MEAPPSHRRPWLVVALALSLALHAALAIWLRSRPERPPLPPANVPIDVTVTYEAPPPVESSPPEVQSPPPPPERVVPSGPRRSTAAPPATAPSAPEAIVQDAPRVEDAPRARVSLIPRLEIAPDVGDSEFPVTPEQAERGLRAPKQIAPEELPSQIAREVKGRANVSRGLVHPYYSALGKTLLKRWDADRAVSRHGLKGFGEQFAENSRAWNNIWLEHAATFGASGNPLSEQDAQPREAVATAPSVDPNLAARQKLKKQMRKEFRATRKAMIKVVQDREGKLVSVELVSPSNDARVDKEAVADVRAAAMELPPPPPEALGSRAELVSLWQFELIISISPPVPTFSFEFDEALGYIDPRLPLDRRLYKRVRLISVD